MQVAHATRSRLSAAAYFSSTMKARNDRDTLHVSGERLKFRDYSHYYKWCERTGVPLCKAEDIDPAPYRFDLPDQGFPEYVQPDVKVKGDLAVYTSNQIKALAGPLYRDSPGGSVLAYKREAVPKSQLDERVETFGSLGVKLLDRLRSAGVVTRATGLLSQRSEILKLLKDDAVLAAAYSLMYAEVPIQIYGGDELPGLLFDMSVGISELKMATRSPDYSQLDIYREKQLKLFPPKRHAAVANRTNVYFSEVLESIRRVDKLCVERFLPFTGLMRGMTNDQAAGVLMAYRALYLAGSPDAALRSISGVARSEQAKNASTAIKSLGLQWQRLGAMLVEMDSLKGRGVEDVDLAAAARLRANTETVDTLGISTAELRTAIRQVLDEEMDMTRYDYEPSGEFWSRRWEWGVNGSHSRVLQRHEPAWAIKPLDLKRLHRRVYLEEVEGNVMDGWSGRVYLSFIKKIENARTRDLQSADSNSYVCFQHLMDGVERCWKGTRVILDPGKGGSMGIAKRMRSMLGGNINGTRLMIDYADYNSQHSLATQKTLVAVLCDKIGYPAGMARRLIASFDDMHMFVDGEYFGRCVGTLMSGHRLTTFINSVMNLVYLRIFCPSIRAAKSAHVGDDVFVATQDLETAARIAIELKASPIRAKPEKQSLGSVSGEFLRMCSRGQITRGYYMRSVASCIMGQWTSELRLEANEALQSIVGASWTLGNRSGSLGIGADLLYASTCRMTGLQGAVVQGLLSGRAGLNNGPIRYSGMLRWSYEIKFERSSRNFARNKYKAMATKAFIENHITPVEREILDYIETTPVQAMVQASYWKSYTSAGGDIQQFYHRPKIKEVCRGIYTGEDFGGLNFREKARGMLEGYTVLGLVSGNLKGRNLQFALMSVGADLSGHESEEELELMAWGKRMDGVVVTETIPYSEAAALNSVAQFHLVRINDIKIYA
nr:MAG: putative RNA-dependent RNA polymerase [Totiviridae sp.]